MNLHSMSRIKFSYCFSVRMTPIGHPVHFNMPASTNQVSLEVFTSTKLVISFPLKSFLNCSGLLPASDVKRSAKELNQAFALSREVDARRAFYSKSRVFISNISYFIL